MYYAFFDVDHTIIGGATAAAFGRELFRKGLISKRDLLRVGAWSALYKVGLLPEVELWQKSMERLVGFSDRDLREACRVSCEQRVRNWFYREALIEMRDHRRRGGVLALVSAGPQESVELLARELGIGITASAWPNVHDGCITDLDGVRIYYGAAKREFIQELCETTGVDPSTCWAYGDSRSDIEMLEHVGFPQAVNPKPALRKVALARGWRIHRWRETSPASALPLRGSETV